MKKAGFNLVFATVLSLTLGSGGTAVHLARQPTLTEAQNRIFDSSIAMWTAGATTLMGLLGAASTNDSGKDNSNG
ncbi:MAG: hypothetical protein ACFCVD_14895 [Nodosilinea sp.]